MYSVCIECGDRKKVKSVNLAVDRICRECRKRLARDKITASLSGTISKNRAHKSKEAAIKRAKEANRAHRDRYNDEKKKDKPMKNDDVKDQEMIKEWLKNNKPTVVESSSKRITPSPMICKVTKEGRFC
jgi:recombinational DNA repair protein (RecF pathway)